MSNSQNRFPGLALVSQTNKKLRSESAGTQWWGPQRPAASIKIQAPSESIRMTVMPTLSRNVGFVAIAWIAQFIRGYFVTGASQRSAVVLSFRRHAAQLRKKSSGSVGWHHTQEAEPLEGGRR